jgi:hypothetical protein
MKLPGTLKIALKEWAVVCAALETGRQILLLRKGGIYEASGEFEIEHRRFLLFPTYLHQKLEMLKPAEHDGFTAVNAEPSRIRISGAGEITDIVQVRDRAAMDRLEDQHIWAKPLIDMRFGYRPQNPLYLLLVRAWRLRAAVTVENTPAYAGCKSWVPMEEEIEMEGAVGVLDDATYAKRRDEIVARIKDF